MKKLLLILALFIASFTSCSNYDGNENVPYYKIKGIDLDYIPTTYKELGKVITFKNQYNHIVRFKTKYYHIFKTPNIRGGILAYDVTSYSDELSISVSLLDMNIDIFTNNECQEFQIQIIKGENLFHTIFLPFFDGEHCSGSVKQFRTPETTRYDIEIMTINNKTYSKVLIFGDSRGLNYYTFYDNSRIHKVYYDMKHGIIGFDDTENNLQYRIIN